MSRRDAVKLLARVAISATLAPVLACTQSRPVDTRPSVTSAPERAPQRLIREIDHVLLRTDDAGSLFDRLSNDLALPVAWPLFTYRGFVSGAVGFGNVNLEVLQHVEGDAPPFAAPPATYPIGLAFEPLTVDDAVRELDARGLAHSEPFEDGISDVIRWTSIDLTGPPECPIMLFVKYSFDQDARRAQLGQQLRERSGGALGIDSVEAVEIGVRDLNAAGGRWQTLFAPEGSTPQWQPGAGPALRLTESHSDRFERIVFRVRSLPLAVDALRNREILGEVTAAYADVNLGEGDPALRLAI
jgi:hypothetical protein